MTQVRFFKNFALLAMVLISLLFATAARTPTYADAGMPSIKTVFIILMENHNWSQIKDSPSAPYINDTLLPMSSYATEYYSPPHVQPSLPNYLWLEAGTNFRILNDKLPNVNHQRTTDHLATLLTKAGISWKAYQEDMRVGTCPITDAYPYAPKHNPFVYFDDVVGNPPDAHNTGCIAHMAPYSQLATDLTNNTVARYNFITPNLCHDMHDSCATRDSVKNGDTWLASEMPTILASQAYQDAGAVFIVWDESEGDVVVPIGMIVTSPLAKGNGYSNAIHYTHGSTLRTLQEIFGVSPFLGDAAHQTDLSDLFSNLAATDTPTLGS